VGSKTVKISNPYEARKMNRTTMRAMAITVFMSIFLLFSGAAASAVTVTTIPLVGDPIELDISGHRISYLDFVSPPNHMRVHSYNFSTGVDTEITPVAAHREDPSCDGDKVVWYEGDGAGLYEYDFNAPVVGGTAIINSGTNSLEPNLSGSILAWSEWNNLLGIYNIWFKQGAASTQITDLPNEQLALHPDVSGNYIVWYWQDVSGAPSTTKMYYYNVASPVSGGTMFASGPSDQSDPRISGNKVVYMDDIDGTDLELFLITLPGGTPQRITDNLANDISPDISGNYVVWERNDQIFMYDIATGQTSQLSDSGIGGFNENPKIDGNHVVWQNQSGTGTSTTYLATIQDETPPAPATPTLPWTGN
jgi:beta propeller repeat protein